MKGPISPLQLVLMAFFSFASAVAQQAKAPDLPEEVLAFADIILYNGTVITVDQRFTLAEAVAIRDGRILAVGSTESVRR